jgi:hypothetical protein
MTLTSKATPTLTKSHSLGSSNFPILVSVFPSTSYSRWKQRDIHEKRELRNHRITDLEAEVACNEVLLTRLRAFQPQLAQSGSSRLSSEVERLRKSPSPEAPKTNAPKAVPYDEMILRLLETIANEARETVGSDQGKLDKTLEERLDFHVKKLSDVTEERRKEKDTLLDEKAKHITMDDLHDGFESKVASFSPAISIAFPAQVLLSMFLRSPNLPRSLGRTRERAPPRRPILKFSIRNHLRPTRRQHQRPKSLPPTLTMKSHA